MSVVIGGFIVQRHLIVRSLDMVSSYPPLPPLFLVILLSRIVRLLFYFSSLHSRVLSSCRSGIFWLRSKTHFAQSFLSSW